MHSLFGQRISITAPKFFFSPSQPPQKNLAGNEPAAVDASSQSLDDYADNCVADARSMDLGRHLSLTVC